MTTDALTLARALSHDESRSGEALAASAGISRAAVWKKIEALRALGLEVRAERGAGYRLAAPIEWLSADAIADALLPPHRWLAERIVIAGSIATTMTHASALAADGAPSATTVFAEHQSAGRGRRGRAWTSPLGSQVSLSMLWRFERGFGALDALGIVVGVALAEALDASGVARVGLKWPNDLVVDGAKLGGVLIEASGAWDGACVVIVGVGINVRLPRFADATIDQPWTDLASRMTPPGRNQLAATLITALADALGGIARGDPREGLAARFARIDALRDLEITFERDGHGVTGLARGIDASGRLRVERDGAIETLVAGDVRVRRA